VAFRAADTVVLQSRQQRPLGCYFPETVTALSALDAGVVLDGELVSWRDGRLDFTALQQRIHPATSRTQELSRACPAVLVVFDLLARRGQDLRARPYTTRRKGLEKLAHRGLPAGLTITPVSTDPAVARSWMLEHAAAGIEGVVAKRLDQTYRPGGRTWRKIRTRMTTEAVVGGVLGPLDQPEALIVGCPDDGGRLRLSGCTTPLPPQARSELAGVLQSAGRSHPWPATIPSNRFAHRPSQPVTYTRVQPWVVVELDVDTAFEQHRWRHPCRFVRVRSDLRAGDLPR
jgi:ATP-dependent DNA ligase